MSDRIIMADKSLTPPSQSPNVEYDVISDEPMVFCEDEQKELPESRCIKIGNLYWSKVFCQDFDSQYYEMFQETEEIGSLMADFMENGEIDLQEASYKLWCLELSIKMVKRYFHKAGVREWKP